MNREDIQQAIDYEVAQGEKKFGTEFKILMTKILCLQKMLTPEVKLSRRIPLSEWENYHEYPTKGTLYQYHHNRHKNGFDYCVESGGENGGRIIIVEDKFFEWQANRKKALS